ncbi:hypothetical protein HOI18_05140 [Candidatus Uhrbacteria bacterium]|jgi:hypothetical protein|nr:hypothetical protein [Candidatus Uhrbacteria bacterium]
MKIQTKTWVKSAVLTAIISTPLIGRAAASLTDPLQGADIVVVISRIIKAILGIVGAIALLMFVWGGLQWVLSAGSPDKIKKGKDTLVWAVIGLTVIIAAYALVIAVVTALEAGQIS